MESQWKLLCAFSIMRCCFVSALLSHFVFVDGAQKICDQDFILNGTLEISSPDYSEPTTKSIECTWQVSNPNGESLLVQSSTDAVGSELKDCKKGSLQIFEGCNSKRFLVEEICSSRHNYNHQGFLWISSGSCITVKYFSGKRQRHSKFRISVTESSVTCGGVLSSSFTNNHTFGGALPSNFKSSECVWIIAVQRGKIELVFKDRFQVTSHGHGCEEDYVKVQNGRYSSSPLIGTFCGTSRPYPVYSSGHYLRVTLHGSKNGAAPKHFFHAQYNVVDSEPETSTGICDGEIFLDSTGGTVRTPNYSQQYPANLQCIWKIEVAESNKIILKFRDFDVEGDTHECPDQAKVFNGLASWSPAIGRYCGSETPPAITSETNKLRIEFHSNSEYAGRGFDAVYFVEGSPPASVSRNHFTGIMIGTTCGIIFIVLSMLAVFHTRKRRIQRVLSRRSEVASTLSFDIHEANAPPSYETVMASPDLFPSNARLQSRGYCSGPHLHREISHLLGDPDSDDEDLPPYPGFPTRDGTVEFLPGRPSGEMRRSSSKERHDSESDNPFPISAVWYRRWPPNSSSPFNVQDEVEGSENQAQVGTLERHENKERARLERVDTSSRCVTDV